MLEGNVMQCAANSGLDGSVYYTRNIYCKGRSVVIFSGIGHP